MFVLLGSVLFFIFVSSSISYVYAYRGSERFASFAEYFRKGWPIFTPLNCLLYLLTHKKGRQAIIDVHKYTDLKPLQKHWEIIRNEALSLYEKGYFDRIKDPQKSSYYDVGFRTFYKYGWSKFYLKWYGYTHQSAQELCPQTLRILEKIPSINGAMFSILPPGSKLTRHLDPVACSLRYHLGLKTPGSQSCFINVDGKDYFWKNGEAFMFDETYLHYARNDTEEPRLILMCDVERPLFLIGSFINLIYKIVMRMAIVPNTDQDKRGLANRVFSLLSPALRHTKALKKNRPYTYFVFKHTVNLIFLCVFLLLFVGIFVALQEGIKSVTSG